LAYNIQYKKSVLKDLADLDKPEARRLVDRIEKELTARPDACPQRKGPFAGLRKLRVGDYRVVFGVFGNDVLVLRIGHRREVYK
jgi:mRNA interferase RelE/StbE